MIFSTYQSSRVVSEGVRGLAPLDVAIFDEAHKTAGRQGESFAHSLKDENIRIRKRLFFTPTPRRSDIHHRDKEGDFRFLSMDDEAIYGPRAHTLTFGSAARQGIICNYKVVISLVDGQEVNGFALKHGITLVDGDLIGAKWVANQIAVERAVEKVGAKRAITFHSRVSDAKQFSTDGTRGIRQFLPAFSVFHVNGDQKSSERKQLIRWFRDASQGLITNARCLTEGIDVPAVDMVVFIDPRHSRIDIAQATGRAMRKPHGSNKEVGYVVIPLFLDKRSGETPEDALARSDFADIADVLNAMQEQDDDLVQIIRELREAKGRGEIFDPRRLSEKIEVIGPSIELSTLRTNIFAEIVDRIGVAWDEWYGLLTLYKNREGHCRVPRGQKENGLRLGHWVSHQRSYKGLPEERRRRLDELGFVWEPHAADWEEGFSHLKAYKEREGHCDVPTDHVENDYKLGNWIVKLRSKRGTVPEERRHRLDQLGFEWAPLETDWEEAVRHLKAYKQREGHCRVPKDHEENGFPLGRWVANRRSRAKSVPLVRRQQLDYLGFVWDVFTADWEEGFSYLKVYKECQGHCRVSVDYKEDGFGLGQWVSTQRLEREFLSEERRQRLDRLGFVWDARRAAWENGFDCLRAYKEREGHCRVPIAHKEAGFRLGQWVNVQRTNRNLPEDRREARMSQERIQRLDQLGFVWKVRGRNDRQG